MKKIFVILSVLLLAGVVAFAGCGISNGGGGDLDEPTCAEKGGACMASCSDSPCIDGKKIVCGTASDCDVCAKKLSCSG